MNPLFQQLAYAFPALLTVITGLVMTSVFRQRSPAAANLPIPCSWIEAAKRTIFRSLKTFPMRRGRGSFRWTTFGNSLVIGIWAWDIRYCRPTET